MYTNTLFPVVVHMSDELNACLIRGNQMKSKTYHSVGTIPKLNIKIIERGKIDIHSTHIHNRSLFLLDTYINCLQHKVSPIDIHYSSLLFVFLMAGKFLVIAKWSVFQL